HEDNGTTYTLESENVWRGNQKFSWNTIQSELDAGRPIMLGFGGPSSPYGFHMTVCVGYNTANDDYVVYLSDSWESEYIGRTLSLSTYNDFFAIVLLVQE
ncbi:MAG: BtrH N-terminal domain-containing protein, partial [Acholeplasmataceae bacterium]|nr:BtrH N-terminal domain-containing protein [Acholeplasmataceae bacterium]